MPGRVRIEFAGVRARRGEVEVLRGVDLSVREGETLALVGRSGAGKSTVLQLINRLLLPSAGRVIVEGRETRAWNPFELRRQVGYVLQEVALFPHMTVAGNVAVVPRLLGWDAAATRALRAGGSGRARAAGLALVVLLAGGAVVAAAMGRGATDTIRVGSKNFTEQVILGELVAQAIATRTSLGVERRLNLGGTFICDRALRAGDIDVYVEYSGTAQSAILHAPPDTDPRRVLESVRARYAEAGITVLDPLGFENTFAMLVRGDDARRLGLRTISDVAAKTSGWRAGFGYEFLQRQDGFPGLARTYGLRFAAPPTAMDLSLIYRALAERQVDFIAGDATSGLVEAYGFVMLEDDRHYFPPYDAVPLARAAVLLAHPELREALASLRMTVADMRRMNHAVDAERRDPADVAREFLLHRRTGERE